MLPLKKKSEKLIKTEGNMRIQSFKLYKPMENNVNTSYAHSTFRFDFSNFFSGGKIT